EWMGLAAGLCWAIGLVAANVAQGSSIIDKTSLQFFCATAFGTVLVLLLDSKSDLPTPDSILNGMPWILASGLWMVGAMTLSLWGAGKMSPARASMLLMLEVIVALAS